MGNAGTRTQRRRRLRSWFFPHVRRPAEGRAKSPAGGTVANGGVGDAGARVPHDNTIAKYHLHVKYYFLYTIDILYNIRDPLGE